MNLSVRNSKLSLLSKQKNLLLLLLGMTLIIILMQQVVINDLGKKSNIVLVPSGLQHRVSLASKNLDEEYLRELAIDISGAIFNVHPGNAAYRQERILKITHPKSYQMIKSKLDREARELKKANGSKSFHPTLVEVDSGEKTAIVHGHALTLAAKGKVVNSGPAVFEVRFECQGLHCLLSNFEKKEAKNA